MKLVSNSKCDYRYSRWVPLLIIIYDSSLKEAVRRGSLQRRPHISQCPKAGRGYVLLLSATLSC